MYILITKDSAYIARTPSLLERQCGYHVSSVEFTQHGVHHVLVDRDEESLSRRYDAAALTRHMSARLFRPSPMELPNLVGIATLILALITVFKV